MKANLMATPAAGARTVDARTVDAAIPVRDRDAPIAGKTTEAMIVASRLWIRLCRYAEYAARLYTQVGPQRPT